MSQIETITDALYNTALGALKEKSRIIIAVFGPPAAGKTTTSHLIAKKLNAQNLKTDVISQDGFHYDDAILDARGFRPRKGAPHTFDVGGLSALLARLLENKDEIAIPTFDRSLELSRNAAAIIPQETQIILCEGNYLLLDDPLWSELRPYFTSSVAIRPDRALIRQRLEERWQYFGLSPEEAKLKIEENDLPNADMVLTNSHDAAFVLNEFD